MTYFLGIACSPFIALLLIAAARWISVRLPMPSALRRIAFIRWDN